MNPELDLTELLAKTADDPVVAPTPKVAASTIAPANSQQSDVFNSDQDKASFNRAKTLMIDESSTDSGITDLEAPTEALKYIHGVVQGRRVYLVTNLLGESEILLQPQLVWTIGRNREAALSLTDRALSRRHAVLLYVQEKGFQLIDLNSMNGSFVNGARIQQRHLLKDGDRVRLGGINFTFFVSQNFRSLDAIHPEVLARFNASESRTANFIDYSELKDPEILFKVTRE